MSEAKYKTKAELLMAVSDMDWPKHGVTAKITKHMPRRSNLQNAALHKLFSIMADELNDAGLDMKVVFKKMAEEGVDVPWDKDSIKQGIWRPIQTSLTGKASTTEISRVEPSAVYDVMARFFADRFGYRAPPFPSKNNQMLS